MQKIMSKKTENNTFYKFLLSIVKKYYNMENIYKGELCVKEKKKNNNF